MKNILISFLILLSSALFAMESNVSESDYYGKTLMLVDGDAQIIFDDSNMVSLQGDIFANACGTSSTELVGKFSLQEGWKLELRSIIFEVENCDIQLGGTAGFHEQGGMLVIFANAEGAQIFAEHRDI